MRYRYLKNQAPILLTKDDEIKESKSKTEKHDYENILKFPQIDNDYYKKKYKRLNIKKVLLIITETLTRSASTISSSTLASPVQVISYHLVQL